MQSITIKNKWKKNENNSYNLQGHSSIKEKWVSPLKNKKINYSRRFQTKVQVILNKYVREIYNKRK